MSLRLITPLERWAGTEAELQRAATAQDVIHELTQTAASTGTSMAKVADMYDEDGNYDMLEGNIYSVHEGVALVNVRGSLVNSRLPNWLQAYVGVTSYASLAESFREIGSRDDIDRVVLNVDSGGGHVAGLDTCMDFLTKLRGQKPVDTYAKDIGSAAYWLASNAESITLHRAGVAGSIGILGVHASYKGAAEAEGIKETVFRSGKYKALGHSSEDLTDEARAEIQRGLDFSYAQFVSDVAHNRQVDVSLVKSRMAEGRVFYGEEALTSGLVDKIGSLDDLMMPRPEAKNRSFFAENGGLPQHAEITHPTVGDEDMELNEALAKITQLEADLTGQADMVAQLTAENTRLQTSHDLLADTVESGKQLATAYANKLQADIEVKAKVLNKAAIVPEDIKGREALLAQLDTEFNTQFPNGSVLGALGNPELEADHDQPKWVADARRAAQR